MFRQHGFSSKKTCFSRKNLLFGRTFAQCYFLIQAIIISCVKVFLSLLVHRTGFSQERIPFSTCCRFNSLIYAGRVWPQPEDLFLTIQTHFLSLRLLTYQAPLYFTLHLQQVFVYQVTMLLKSIKFAIVLALAFAMGLSSCKPAVDRQFVDSVQQDAQQADSAMASLATLQSRMKSLSDLIKAAPEDVRKAAPQRLDELAMAAEEYGQKIAVNLEPFQQEIGKGKQLSEDYAVGKISLEDARKQFEQIKAQNQLVAEMKAEFETAYEQFDREFKAIAKEALTKSGISSEGESEKK